MKKTQTGWVFFVVVAIIIGVVSFQSPDLSATIILYGVSILLLMLFYKLTITITDEFISFSFGIGLIQRKYRLEDVQSCKSKKYFPFGWGIRWRPGVIIYNVSGNKAIELSLKNKKRKVWIGTDDPEELADYINKKLMMK